MILPKKIKQKKGSIVFLPEELLLIIGVLIIALIILLILNIVQMVPGASDTVQINADAIDFPVPRTCDTNLMNLIKFDAPKPDGWSTSADFTYSDAIAYLEIEPTYVRKIINSTTDNSIVSIFDSVYGVRAWGFEVVVAETDTILSVGIPFSKNTFECVTYVPSFDLNNVYIQVKLILPEAEGL